MGRAHRAGGGEDSNGDSDFVQTRRYPGDPLGQEARGRASCELLERKKVVRDARHVAGGGGGSSPGDKGNARPRWVRMAHGRRRSTLDRGSKWAADRWVWVTVLLI
jgi:hypothetical protein